LHAYIIIVQLLSWNLLNAIYVQVLALPPVLFFFFSYSFAQQASKTSIAPFKIRLVKWPGIYQCPACQR
jgi:hypothetical protein